MKKYSTWMVSLLATIPLLAAAVSLGICVAPGEAAVVAGSQEIRWYENGPYQGNPDDPSIDRPQTLDPESMNNGTHSWSGERFPVYLPFFGSGVIIIELSRATPQPWAHWWEARE